MNRDTITLQYQDEISEVKDPIEFAEFVYRGHINLWNDINEVAGYLPDYIEKISIIVVGMEEK